MIALLAIFVFSALYAVISNIIVYSALKRRKIPLPFGRSGMPGYLYRVCAKEPTVGTALRRFAFSTNVAYVIAFLSGLGIAGMTRL